MYQPQVYRSIIDDVVANIQVDFEEYGMEEEVLINLQAKWEAKLLETRVADFARVQGSTATTASPDIESLKPINSSPSGRFSIQQNQYSHALPPPSHGLALPGQLRQGHGYEQNMTVKVESDELLRIRGGASPIPESKPFIPVDRKPEPNAAGLLPGDEVINSDLDDSDDEVREEDDGGEEEGEVDIVFCVYDKVQRVKNKWKTTFKDGMIHINGRDYLFAKCSGEFEW
ncbi:MAG: hypothetical protein TREMPRED_005413 [Tremellales sp. Tagirdzhanova-0007]|nr:MAG: hypothetical protein TREMPRED_005413 [Tremellales sp. Tagirdzhanova-0007]